MSDLPTCSAPNGATVTVTIPPGWYTYVSSLARNNFNQTILMQIKNSSGENKEEYCHSPKKPTETNEPMKRLSNRQDSYYVNARNDFQELKFTSYYSKDLNIKDYDLVAKNAVAKGLKIRQAQTPEHLLKDFPHYITFFVFVQASPDQKETEYAPLFNDAVCTINLIKGTHRNHDGVKVDYDGSGGSSINPNSTTGQGTTGGATGGGATDEDPNVSNTALDIVFVQDCTASQQPYIKASIDSIINISDKIASSANLASDALRLRLIGFRDAKDEYVTKPFPFTTDKSVMRKNLSTLVANGGGDGPEAVAEALDEALMSDWRLDATKLVILITDAAPHGISEPNDGDYQDQSPQSPPSRKEPLKIVRRMAELGITLHLIACEPTLSRYRYAHDFYKAVTKITGGLVLPLVSASKLADYIIGSSLERVELDALVAKHGKDIARGVLYRKESQETLIEKYYGKFDDVGVTITTLEIEPVYAEYPEAIKNVDTFYNAKVVATAHPLPLHEVSGARLLPKFASGTVSPTVTLVKQAISKEQTARVIKQSIAKNARVLPSGEFAARPTSENPKDNSFRIHVPKEWYGFITGLPRAKYNQMIKLGYTIHNYTNAEFLVSERGRTGDVMALTQNDEHYYTFIASDESAIILDASFFWSKDKKVKGEMLNNPQYASKDLKVIEIKTVPRSYDTFPDYITYFIMAEDQPEAEQVAGVPSYNDCVGVVNLIRKTPMVFNSEE